MNNSVALIVWGGWEGHQPKEVSEFFEEMLTAEGYQVIREQGTKVFESTQVMEAVGLIVPVITMSEITLPQVKSVEAAVAERGVGMAGCHGGMCDAFRASTEWQFITGSQWVAHPGDSGVTYEINITDHTHPIVEGIEDFLVTSEQYYLHVDPGVNVLATTRFPSQGAPGPHYNNPCDMPQIYTKWFGSGRVFYCALGHQLSNLTSPTPREIMRRGFLWASNRLG